MFDEFNNILENDGPVKILITTQLKPPVKIYDFLRELMMVFHNIAFYPRRDMKLEEVYKHAKTLNFTHVMVLRFSNGWELLIRHLEGMLAVFKITSVEYQKKIKHHAVAT
jgi:rRNA maturation protein Rpf1